MKLGYVITGSFCTISRSISVLKELVKAHEVIPILSENVQSTDTRFGKASDTVKAVSDLCGRPPMLSITETETLGPLIPLDAMIIAPCTGNTLAKLASGITDTTALMAAKAHLRCDRPLVIALATNDALSQNLKNVATLLSRKGVYFVPFGQDDAENKPHSLVCDFSMIEQTLGAALSGKQLQPLFFEY